MTKTCTVCGETKDITLFCKDKPSPTGYKNPCSKCALIRAKQRRDANIDDARRKQRERYNYETFRLYYDKNKDKITAGRKKRYAVNKNKENAYSNEYHRKHPLSPEQKAYRREYLREYTIKNRGVLNEKRALRIKADPLRILKESIRCRIKNFIRKKEFKKNFYTQQVLGIDYEGLKVHLERLFLEGMSWENHGIGEGKWHIDHVTPLASATTESRLIRLFHYTNLQPLWSIDNIKKGKKMPIIQTSIAC